MKVQASKSLKRGRPHAGKGASKYQNFSQSHEVYQLKKREINPIKLQA
jgi:hypothetical protein